MCMRFFVLFLASVVACVAHDCQATRRIDYVASSLDAAETWTTARIKQDRLQPATDCDPVHLSDCRRVISFTLDVASLSYEERSYLCDRLSESGRGFHVSSEYGGPLKCSYAAESTCPHYLFIAAQHSRTVWEELQSRSTAIGAARRLVSTLEKIDALRIRINAMQAKINAIKAGDEPADAEEEQDPDDEEEDER